MCVPGLHISLGVFFRLYTLLEEACHKLDLAFAKSTGSLSTEGGYSFDNYVSALHQLFQLKEETEQQTQAVSVLDQLSTYLALTLQEGSPALDRVMCEARVQKKQLQDMVYIILLHTMDYTSFHYY